MYLDAAQFPCPVSLEFDFEMNSCQITRILRCVGLATVPVLLRCFAEAPRKEHMPKQRMPSQSPSPRQTNVAKEKPKMKASESPKGRMKTNHNQKPRKKRSGTVVAEAKTKKTRSRKLAEGLCVKCMSRKLALWSRKHCGSCCGSGE